MKDEFVGNLDEYLVSEQQGDDFLRARLIHLEAAITSCSAGTFNPAEAKASSIFFFDSASSSFITTPRPGSRTRSPAVLIFFLSTGGRGTLQKTSVDAFLLAQSFPGNSAHQRVLSVKSFY
jgi:hypothetical protein